MNKKEPLGSET